MSPNHPLVASIGSDAALVGLAVFAVAFLAIAIYAWRSKP